MFVDAFAGRYVTLPHAAKKRPWLDIASRWLRVGAYRTVSGGDRRRHCQAGRYRFYNDDVESQVATKRTSFMMLQECESEMAVL